MSCDCQQVLYIANASRRCSHSEQLPVKPRIEMKGRRSRFVDAWTSDSSSGEKNGEHWFLAYFAEKISSADMLLSRIRPKVNYFFNDCSLCRARANLRLEVEVIRNVER